MTRVGPTKQPFSWRSLIGDLLEQVGDVINELQWFPKIVGRHFKASQKYRAAQTKMHERAALEIEALTSEKAD